MVRASDAISLSLSLSLSLYLSLTLSLSLSLCLLLPALQVITRSAFALVNENWLDEGNLYGRLIEEHLSLHMKRVHRPALLLSDTIYYLTANGKREIANAEEVYTIVREYVSRRRSYLDETSTNVGSANGSRKQQCVIDILLTTKDEDGEGLSVDDILFESNAFLFAGYDTTSITLQWLCYFLARHKEHQEKCRIEVDEAFAGGPTLGTNNVSQLTYTTQCVMETLRFRPPIQAAMRKLDDDLPVDSYTIPAGSIISFEIYGIHRHPDFWEKPDCFHPDNFREELSRDRHPFTFLPFTAGPRRCLGEMFAVEEIKTVIAYILRHFTLSLLTYEEVEPDTSAAFLRPRGGINLVVRPRQ